MSTKFITTVSRPRSAREQIHLLKIRFSLLMLQHRNDQDAYDKVRMRCRELEEHLNRSQPSSWFLAQFGQGPAFYKGMLISAHEDMAGWHVAPLRGFSGVSEVQELSA